jgi:hypothetical protein
VAELFLGAFIVRASQRIVP